MLSEHNDYLTNSLTTENRLRVYHHAIGLYENLLRHNQTEKYHGICSVLWLSAALLNLIPTYSVNPIPLTILEQTSLFFPEFANQRPAGIREANAGGMYWWVFGASGLKARIKALQNAVQECYQKLDICYQKLDINEKTIITNRPDSADSGNGAE